MTVVGSGGGRHASTAERAWPLFEPSTDESKRDDESAGEIDFVGIQRSPEFRRLRRKQRLFVFPMSALFMVWFFAYVLLSAYARGFMATRVLGLINIGILMGLAQFVSTIVIMVIYCWYADRELEPCVDDVHARSGARA